MNLPVLYQRLEGIAVILAAIYFYAVLGYSWLWFGIVLLAVDACIAGYVFGKHFGAHVYNIGHSLFVPLGLLAAGHMLAQAPLTGLSLIWLAHIGMDRALGFGLKTTKGFYDTHLGRIGHE